MFQAGGVFQQLGLASAVGGYGLWAGSLVFRMGWLLWRREIHRGSFLVGFYARAAGTLGLMIMFTGMIVKGSLGWPWLIAVFVLGAPSLALLLVRPVRDEPFKVDLPKRGKS